MREKLKFDIKNLSEDKAQLFFYGDIVGSELDAWSMDDQFPSAIKDFLKEYEGKEIELHVNSGGGSCFAGICIAEMLRKHKGKVVAIVDGLSASIATLICCSADEVHINQNSYWMIHNAWTGVCGNKNDLLETAELLEKMDNTILEAYMKHTKEGITREQIADMMDKETWLCGKEILDYFDFVLEEEEKVAYAKVDFNNYKNIPKSLLDELQKEDEEVCEKCGKNPCECEEQQTDEKVEDKVEEEKVEETQEEIITEEEQQEEEIVDEEEKDDNKIGELKIEEEDEDDDVIKIKFVNQQEEEIVEDSCKKDDKKDKCEKDDKKCLVMKCPECDYEGEFDMDEEGNYVCPECGFKLEPDKEEEPDIDENEDMENECKTDDEKDACKKKEKAQAQAKKELEFLKAKMFLDNFK